MDHNNVTLLDPEALMVPGSPTRGQRAPLSDNGSGEKQRLRALKEEFELHSAENAWTKSDLSKHVFTLSLLLIVAVAVVLYVALGWNWAKFSRAEVFFSECAREMLRDKNYITPLYHGQGFFDKPILVYWFILAMFKTFGVSHLAARIPSIIAAATTIVMTGWVGSKLFNRLSGALAAMALSSSFMFIGFAYLCMSDMTLVMFSVLTMSFLYAGTLMEPRRNQMWCLAAFSAGMAFLTKGPIGIVFPILAFLIFLGLTKQLSIIKLRHVVSAALIALVVSLPWWIAAYKANGAGALIYFFVRENLIRYAGSTYDTHKPIWFMLVSLLTGFAPWSVFLPLVLFGSIKKWSGLRAIAGGAPGCASERARSHESKHELFLWVWIAVVIGFFSFSRGKCDYYALPAYPAAALLTGLYLSRWIRRGDRPAVIGGWLLGAGYFVTACGALFILQNMSSAANAVPCAWVAQWVLMPAILGTSALIMFILMRTRQLYAVYMTAFIGLCLSATCFATQVIPGLVQLIPIGQFAFVLNNLPGAERLGVQEALGPWIDEITFQTNREPVKLTNEQMEQFLAAKEASLVVTSEDKLERLTPATKAKLRVLDRRVGITHTLTPGYAIQRKGHLTDPIPVVLVTNR